MTIREERITVFITSDNASFNNREDAENHARLLVFQEDLRHHAYADGEWASSSSVQGVFDTLLNRGWKLIPPLVELEETDD